MKQKTQTGSRPGGWRSRAGFALAVLLLSSAATGAQPDELTLIERLREGGHVLMIRHALAPGTGDPEGFRLEDCATQRNLDATGRAQARAIGEWLRARGIAQARVHASQWCRCRETAEHLALGPVTPLPALNSFFGQPQDRDAKLKALRGFLAAQPRAGAPLVLVTHQMTIAAITREPIASGHGAVLALGSDGALTPVGQLGFGQ